MSYTSIKNALNDYLNTNQGSIINIYWEGVSGSPDQTTPYLFPRISAITSTPNGPGVDSVIIRSGNYQVSAYFPTGQGTANADEKVDEICALFKRGTTLITSDNLTIIMEVPDPKPALQDQNYLHIPIIIPWFVYEVPS